MNYSERFLIAAPLEQVWAFVEDGRSLIACIPGSSHVTRTEDGGISAVITDRVGPFGVEFHVTGSFAVDTAEHRIASDGSGKDVKLGNTLTLKVNLQVQQVESGQVEVVLDADVNIAGKVASLGFGIMKDKARKTMTGFVSNMRERMAEGVVS